MIILTGNLILSCALTSAALASGPWAGTPTGFPAELPAQLQSSSQPVQAVPEPEDPSNGGTLAEHGDDHDETVIVFSNGRLSCLEKEFNSNSTPIGLEAGELGSGVLELVDAVGLRHPLPNENLDVVPAQDSIGTLNPAVHGRWESSFELPLIAIHAATMPTGEVLLTGSRNGVPGIHADLLEPRKMKLTAVDPPGVFNTICSGHTLLADGRILVIGGTNLPDSEGWKEAFLFDPFSREWTQVPDYREGRWYPTAIALDDSRVLTMSGYSDLKGHGKRNEDIEVWDPLGPGNWELISERFLHWFPLLHVMGRGRVFMAGPGKKGMYYDVFKHKWTLVDERVIPARFEAPSVLVPGFPERVMVIGGLTGGQKGGGMPTKTVEMIDLEEPNPKWKLVAPMHQPRMEHDAVILPDATVLALGGKLNEDLTSPQQAVMVPEIYDPLADTWTRVAPHAFPRVYHSTTILLPDARVLASGGVLYASGEIYSPPYLFQPGNRPEIVNAPETLAYGRPFSLKFSSDTEDNKVILIRLSSGTHSVNFGQRYVELGEGGPNSPFELYPPAEPWAAPPGFYMLFVVDQRGVPSISKIVQLREG